MEGGGGGSVARYVNIWNDGGSDEDKKRPTNKQAGRSDRSDRNTKKGRDQQAGQK